MKRFKSKTKKLGSLVEMQTGFQVRGKVEPNPSGNYSLIQVKDLDRETFHVDAKKLEKIEVPEKREGFMDKYLVDPTEVLYLSKGSKPGAFVLDSELEYTIPMAHFYILKPKNGSVETKFLCWALNQDFMNPFLSRSLKGSGIPFISKPDLADWEVPVPSLEAQRKIVELWQLRVEEKRLERQLEEAKDKLINEILERNI